MLARVRELGSGQVLFYFPLRGATVTDLKMQIESVTGIPPKTQSLQYGAHGAPMDDDSALLETYGLKHESSIFLSTRLGGPRKTVEMWREPISAPDWLRQMPTFFDRNTFFSLFPDTKETDYWLYLEWHRTQVHISERIGTDASASDRLWCPLEHVAEAVGAEDMEAAADAATRQAAADIGAAEAVDEAGQEARDIDLVD
jgi:hypothetical protein